MATRTAYVSRLRRAFLLRAHPDRFRSHSQSIRKGQAKVIQGLSERLVAPDFTAYTSSRHVSPAERKNLNATSWETHAYYLEGKDGSLSQFNLRLDDTVECVLTSMRKALQSSGLSNIPLPPAAPPPAPQKHLSVLDHASFQHLNQYASGAFNAPFSDGIDRAFDRNTAKGRDLMAFLTSIDPKDIAERKADRLDANAAALVARQAFKFQSIDGIRLGWSSRNFARCLNTLTKAYDDHHPKFKVPSFYPLRLVLSNDESLNKIDLFGGTIMLNPASTQLQWLETLMEVEGRSLDLLRDNRVRLKELGDRVENSLNVRLRRGFSCSSREYHQFLERLSSVFDDRGAGEDAKDVRGEDSKALALDRITVTVETDQAYRRPLVTDEGHIRISAGMSLDMIESFANDCRDEAIRKTNEEVVKQEKANELVEMVKSELGLTNVYKGHIATITSDRFLNCLQSLLSVEEVGRKEMRNHMEGQILRIAGERRSCHLGDDGSIIIPCDWNRTR